MFPLHLFTGIKFSFKTVILFNAFLTNSSWFPKFNPKSTSKSTALYLISTSPGPVTGFVAWTIKGIALVGIGWVPIFGLVCWFTNSVTASYNAFLTLEIKWLLKMWKIWLFSMSSIEMVAHIYPSKPEEANTTIRRW